MSDFEDTNNNGIPNLYMVAPKLWRMGQPVGEGAWRYLHQVFGTGPVTIVKLDDEKEGSDDLATSMFAWSVVRFAIPPEDDRPWTALEKPDPATINLIVDTILMAHAGGQTVAWHCVHGRDRTGLITALVGMKLLGWTKAEAWQNMLDHGFRWELPDLDAYWLEDVK